MRIQGASTVLRLICLVMLISTLVFTSPAEPFRQILTIASRNIHLDTWRVTHSDFDFKPIAPWSVHKYTLRGGKQAGVDVVVVNNGRLNFIVVPTRGMSVLTQFNQQPIKVE